MRPLFPRLMLGVSLLNSYEDCAQLMLTLQQQMPALSENEKMVLMGYGVNHHAFTAHVYLSHMMVAQYFPARVGTVEGYSGVDVLIESLSQEGVATVHLMPLMLVAGDHAINDMASDEGGSWKTLFNTAGIPATPWLSGLGENPAVRAMFMAHLQQVFSVTLKEAA